MQNSIFDIFGSHGSNVVSAPKPRPSGRSTVLTGSRLHATLKGAGHTVVNQKSVGAVGRTPLKSILGDVGNKLGKQILPITNDDVKKSQLFPGNQLLQKKIGTPISKKTGTPLLKKTVIHKTPILTNKIVPENENFDYVIDDILVDMSEDDEPYFENSISPSKYITKQDLDILKMQDYSDFYESIRTYSPPVSPNYLMDTENEGEEFCRHMVDCRDMEDMAFVMEMRCEFPLLSDEEF